MAEIIKLNAKNDINGNPRRCYVVIRSSRIIAVVQDMYGDAKSIARRLAGGNGADYALEIPTTPAFLKLLYREAKAAGTFYAD